MKNMTYTLKLLLTMIVFLSIHSIVFAVTWQDDFDQVTTDNWQLQGTDSLWQIEDGTLKAGIQTEKQWRTLFELYQYTAFPGPYNTFTITLENIGASGEVRFGIALGKYFYSDDGDLEEIGYYLFFTNDMQASRDGKIFLGPGKRWNTDVLNDMSLNFDGGRFELFGDGESRMDFTDANLPSIDLIGFVLVGYVTDSVNTGEAWVEKITISGLAVSPKDKLTTVWGQLKRE